MSLNLVTLIAEFWNCLMLKLLDSNISTIDEFEFLSNTFSCVDATPAAFWFGAHRLRRHPLCWTRATYARTRCESARAVRALGTTVKCQNSLAWFDEYCVEDYFHFERRTCHQPAQDVNY